MNAQTFLGLLATSFEWVGKTSLQATVLIALVGVNQFLGKRVLAPRWRYALWLLVLARLALPVVPAASFSVFNLAMPFRLPVEHSAHVDISNPMPAAPLPRELLPERGQDLPRPTGKLTITLPNPSPQTEGTRAIAGVTSNTHVAIGWRDAWPSLAFFWLAGCGVMLGAAARQQWRLARQLRGQAPVTEPRIVALLEECKARLGVKRSVAVLAVNAPGTPALFGCLRPRLLVPQAMLQSLNDDELRLIFLHELTHLKRGDIAVNWAVIWLRSLHWFNPAVWFAMRQLRMNQELACDAAVMACLHADERRLYGTTLIKLLADFSATPFCPGLVPFITNKQIIKRRIIMIAKFKPASRPALVLSVILLVALGAFTFTRAADAPKKASADTNVPVVTDAVKVATPQSAHTISGEVVPTQVDRKKQEEDAAILKEMVWRDQSMMAERALMDARADVSALRKKLSIPSDIAEGQSVAEADEESIRHYRTLIIDNQSELVKQATLLAKLKELPPEERKQAIPTAAPDSGLSDLLQSLATTETKLVTLKSDFGPTNPEVQRVEKLKAELNKQIDDRVKGILNGMEMRIAALKAVVDDATGKIETARQIESELPEKYQPYFEKKHALELLQKKHDEMNARLDQARMERTLIENGLPAHSF